VAVASCCVGIVPTFEALADSNHRRAGSRERELRAAGVRQLHNRQHHSGLAVCDSCDLSC
jgi:hypothetical protein